MIVRSFRGNTIARGENKDFYFPRNYFDAKNLRACESDKLYSLINVSGQLFSLWAI